MSTGYLQLPGEWSEAGLCAQTDPEAFFPEKGGSTREAKKVCVACPVKAQCLAYALDTNQRFGIWGGLSERERRALQPKKKTPARIAAAVETATRETTTTNPGGAQPAKTRGPRRTPATPARKAA
jgi:WhiB family redox-sensing transcriptional regulator